jgi:hypothetical protein
VDARLARIGGGDDDLEAGSESVAAARARNGGPITAEQYRRLGEIGVLGEKVELFDGWITYGRFAFAVAPEAIVAAQVAGIELTAPRAPRPAASGG